MGCDCRRNLRGEVIDERKLGFGGRLGLGVLQFLFNALVVFATIIMIPLIAVSLAVSLLTSKELTVFVPSKLIDLMERNGKQQKL